MSGASYFFKGIFNKTKTYKGSDRPNNSKLPSQQISKQSNQDLYNSFLQGCFNSYLINQATYYAKFNGWVSIEQLGLNAYGPNLTFNQYLQWVGEQKNNIEILSLAQKTANNFSLNVLTNANVNQNEFLEDCSKISMVYEALLAKQSDSKSGKLTSIEASKFVEDYKQNPQTFFYGTNFLRGDYNSGEEATNNCVKMSCENPNQIVDALEIIKNSTIFLEQTVTKDYGDFKEVADLSDVNKQETLPEE